MTTPRPPWLVINADDFGIASPVNEAVAEAHQKGVLTAASLMIGAPAAHAAVSIARRLPNLRIGLHLVVADGRAVLDPDSIPSLADSEGAMNARIISRSFRLLCPGVYRQLRAELKAQFRAFRRTGLTLDHVNVHKHLQLHPLILQLVINEVLANGSPPVRVPYEPLWVAASYGRPLTRLAAQFTNIWSQMARARLRRVGIAYSDAVFGLSNRDGMNEPQLCGLLQRLSPGINEIYLHPSQATPQDGRVPDQRARAKDLLTLLSPSVKTAIYTSGVRLGGYRDALR